MKDVLIVEDEDNLRSLFASTLADAGYTISEVRLAADAVDVIRQKVPDLILLDAVMPPGQMSGMELLARLRENDAWAAIPVIIVSGIGDLINRDAATRLGVRAVLAKPISMADLRANVEKVIGA